MTAQDPTPQTPAYSVVAPAERSPQGRSKGLLIALIAALLVIVVLLAWIITDRVGANDPHSTDASTSQSDDSSGQAGSGEPASDGEPTQGGGQTGAEGTSEAAQAYTDPQVINIIKGLHERNPDSPLAIGAVDAPVVMLEFSDFSCPFCARYSTDVYPQLKKYVDDGTLRIEFHPWAIFTDYGSDIAARGAWAAGKQGTFDEYFSIAGAADPNGHATWTVESVTAAAQQAGVPDMEQFAADLDSAEAQAELAKTESLAAQIGFTGTPAFVINNRIINGLDDVNVFEATIEAAAADVQAGAF